MKVLKFVWGHGKKKADSGLQTVEEEYGYGKGRGRSKFFKGYQRTHWWMKPFESSPEEQEEVWKLAEEYLFKILDYADKDQLISPEELARYRDLFRCLRHGPRARHFAVQPNTALTSADVLLILTSTLPASKFAERYNIRVQDVKGIRKGESQAWDWEYRFVKRIKAIIRNKQEFVDQTSKRVYCVWKVISPENRQALVFTTSRVKARELRDALVPTKERRDLQKQGLYDIAYPIERVDLM